MAKRESTFFNMVSTLVIISAISGLALAGVKLLTEDAIAEAERKKLESALETVLPKFDNDIGSDTAVVKISERDQLVFYFARMGEELVGTAVETYSHMGYSGLIRIMVGFSPDGSIINTAVISHAETPGLGDKIDVSKSNFPLQFKGMDPGKVDLKVDKDGGDIDGITAATITARAFCDAVQRAHDEFIKLGGSTNE